MLFQKILKNFPSFLLLFCIAGIVLWIFIPEQKPYYECVVGITIPNEVLSNPEILSDTAKLVSEGFKVGVLGNKLTIRGLSSSKESCSPDFEEAISQSTKSISNKAKSFLRQNLSKLEDQINQLQRNIGVSKNKIDQLSKKEAEFLSEYEGTKQSWDSLDVRVKNLELEREKLLLLYTEDHPDVIAIAQELTILKKRLNDLPQPEKGYLIIQKQLEDVKSSLVEKQLELASLKVKKQNSSNPADFSLFVDKSEIKTLGKEELPKHIKVSATAFFISIALFIVLIILDRRIYIRKQLEGYREVRLIATLRRFRKRNHILGVLSDPGFINQRAAFSYIDEFFRNKKIILVSSCKKKEGKTLCAINLAAYLAKEGKKVVLVDLNFHNPQLARKMPYVKKPVFINDAFQYQNIERKLFNFGLLALDNKKIQAQIKSSGLDKMSVLFAKKERNSRIKQHKDTLLSLAKNYDCVVCDLGVLSHDLAREIDRDAGLLLVVRASHSGLKDIRKAESILAPKKTVSRGLVLNSCI